MTEYNPGLKEQLIKRMLPPNNCGVPVLSEETGIPLSTLYTWRQKALGKNSMSSKPNKPSEWSAKAKLAAIIQTATMTETERAAYCREHGLYIEQLDDWKIAFESLDLQDTPAGKRALAAERKKRRKLERDLVRKEKALAETAALLVLSKKVEAIWGSGEAE